MQMKKTRVSLMGERRQCVNMSAVFFYITVFLSASLLKPSVLNSHMSEKHEVVMTEKILDATEEQLKLAQAKITYLGEQEKPIPTVVFSTEGHKVSLACFLNVQRSPKPYANDEMPYTRYFSVTPREFQRMLSAVKPIITRIDAAKGPEFISFCVIRKIDADFEGHEFRIGPASGKTFCQKLIGALDAQNQFGRDELIKQFTNIYPD